MKQRIRNVGLLLVSACTLFISGVSLATMTAAPAAAEFYPLLGKWHGHGQLSEPGHPPVKLSLRLYCQKVSSGWAVRCAMQANNPKMRMSESDLMGVDPVTGQGHWYAVTNTGDTHDHLASWPNPHTMLAHYDWTQNGKHMHEAISFKFTGRHRMHFKSVVTADGQTVNAFSGKFSH